MRSAWRSCFPVYLVLSPLGMIQLSFLGFLQGDDVREMDTDWIAKEMPSTVGASARDNSITRDKINNRSAITYRLHRKKKTRIIKKKRTETRSFFSSHYRHSQ